MQLLKSMKKSKIAIVVFAVLCAFVLSATLVKAQTADELNTQYRQLLTTLINLLLEQVRVLTLKVAQIHAEQLKLSGMPYGYPALPRFIENTESKNVLESGKVLPVVKLRARSTQPLERGSHEGDGLNDFKTTWVEQGETLSVYRPINQEIYSTWNARLGIFVGVGNPDKDFVPEFECWKFGAWTGKVAPYDHWEEDVSVGEGEYGVTCGMQEHYSDGRINVKMTH